MVTVVGTMLLGRLGLTHLLLGEIGNGPGLSDGEMVAALGGGDLGKQSSWGREPLLTRVFRRW